MNFQPPEEDDPRDEDQLMQAALSQPTPQGVAGVELREKFYRNLSTDTLISTLITIVQERDAHRAALDPAVAEIVKLKARVAELEGDVARDAARYRFRHSNYHDADGYEYGFVKIKFGGFGQPVESVLWATDAEIDAAIAAAKEPSHG